MATTTDSLAIFIIAIAVIILAIAVLFFAVFLLIRYLRKQESERLNNNKKYDRNI